MTRDLGKVEVGGVSCHQTILVIFIFCSKLFWSFDISDVGKLKFIVVVFFFVAVTLLEHKAMAFSFG
jgi:hypothetical protein